MSDDTKKNDVEVPAPAPAADLGAAEAVVPLDLRFADLFAGLTRGYGTYTVDAGELPAGTKRTGKALTHKLPLTLEHYRDHLNKKDGRGLGVIAIREDDKCVFGAIDVDQYDIEHSDLLRRIRKLNLPLVPCQSKSEGLHLYLFMREPIPAALMRGNLKQFAGALGLPDATEIFPKQDQLLSDEDVGNWINLPYYGGLRVKQYEVERIAYDLKTETCEKISDFARFLDYADSRKITAATLAAICDRLRTSAATSNTAEPAVPVVMDYSEFEGPPCIESMMAKPVDQGGRNDVIAHIGVYAVKAGLPVEATLQDYNQRVLAKPLDDTEVKSIAKSMGRKQYRFFCKHAAVKPHCQSTLCAMRKFGLGGFSHPVVRDLALSDEDRDGLLSPAPCSAEKMFQHVVALVRCGLPDARISPLLLDLQGGAGDFARDNLDSLPSILRKARAAATPEFVKRLNDTHCTLTTGGKFVVHSFDKNGNSLILAPGAYKDMSTTRVRVGRAVLLEHDAWLKSPMRRSHESLVIEPGQPPITADNNVNLWRGLAVKPGNARAARPWLRHVFEVICRKDRRAYWYVKKCFAHLVQRPGERLNIALVFRGKRGTGKNAVTDRLVMIFGEGSHAVTVSSPEDFADHFNYILVNKLLVVVNEGFWAGDKKKEMRLKNMVNGRTIPLTQKYHDTVSADNHLSFLLLSNEEWVVPAGDHERRFYVLDVDDSKIGNTAHFDAVFAVQPADILAALLQVRIPAGFRPWLDVPKNPYLVDQQIESMSDRPVHGWLYEVLSSGVFPDAQFTFGQDVPIGYLHEWFEHSTRAKLAREAFAKRIRKIIGATNSTMSARCNYRPPGEREQGMDSRVMELVHHSRTVWLPTLREAREAYEKDMGWKSDHWPEHTEDKMGFEDDPNKPASTSF